MSPVIPISEEVADCLGLGTKDNVQLVVCKSEKGLVFWTQCVLCVYYVY